MQFNAVGFYSSLVMLGYVKSEEWSGETINMLALCAAEKCVVVAEGRSSKVLFIKAQIFFY